MAEIPGDGVEMNDAGILRVAQGLRAAADTIAMHVSEHNQQHENHGCTDCDSGRLLLAEIMMSVSTTMGLNAMAIIGDFISEHIGRPDFGGSE